MNHEPREHWRSIYQTKPADGVSWYQPVPAVSLDLVDACALPPDAPIIDVGAGASTLVDGLLARGFSDVTLLDIADTALDVTRARLGALAQARVSYVVADVTAWSPPRQYALWHDRAVFHFLVDAPARAAYLSALERGLRPGGSAILATFADDGPERCSGLVVRRYSIDALERELASVLRMVEHRHETHTTPWGSEQRFNYGRFVRAA